MREQRYATDEFALGALRDPRRLERIESDLGQIRGVAIVDIDLTTGSVRIEYKDDDATHAAVDTAIRGLGGAPTRRVGKDRTADRPANPL